MNCRHCHTAIAIPGESLCGACDELLEEAEETAISTAAKPRAPKTANTEHRERIRLAALCAVEHAQRRTLAQRNRCIAPARHGRPCRNLALVGDPCKYHASQSAITEAAS